MRSDPEVDAHLDVLAHAQPERGDPPPALDGGVGDLLDAVEVAGEAGGDDAPVAVLGEQRAQDPPDAALARRVAGLLGVGRVGEQHADPGRSRASSPMRARSVRRSSTGVRSSLKSPECRITPWLAVHGDGVGVGHAVGHGDELDVEGADPPPLAVGDDVQRGPPEQPGLLDAVAGEPERDRRPVDREAELAQQERDPTDVVLVAVGGDQRLDPLGVLAEVGEVGQHEIDAVEVGAGEHQPAVDEQDPAGRRRRPARRPCSCARSPPARRGRRGGRAQAQRTSRVRRRLA